MCHKVSLMAARHQAVGQRLLKCKVEEEKKGGDGGESSSAGVHIAACLFSVLVTDCKRAVCAAHQRLQALCYSVMLIIFEAAQILQWKINQYNRDACSGKDLYMGLGSC